MFRPGPTAPQGQPGHLPPRSGVSPRPQTDPTPANRPQPSCHLFVAARLKLNPLQSKVSLGPGGLFDRISPPDVSCEPCFVRHGTTLWASLVFTIGKPLPMRHALRRFGPVLLWQLGTLLLCSAPSRSALDCRLQHQRPYRSGHSSERSCSSRSRHSSREPVGVCSPVHGMDERR
jgi:hypothetical protein